MISSFVMCHSQSRNRSPLLLTAPRIEPACRVPVAPRAHTPAPDHETLLSLKLALINHKLDRISENWPLRRLDCDPLRNVRVSAFLRDLHELPSSLIINFNVRCALAENWLVVRKH